MLSLQTIRLFRLFLFIFNICPDYGVMSKFDLFQRRFSLVNDDSIRLKRVSSIMLCVWSMLDFAFNAVKSRR